MCSPVKLAEQNWSVLISWDYVIDEEYGSGIVMAGFPPEEHIAVIYRVRDGLIDDVVLLM